VIVYDSLQSPTGVLLTRPRPHAANGIHQVNLNYLTLARGLFASSQTTDTRLTTA
jgi:hypothetical protein